MGKSEYSNYIKHYDTIRGILRDFYIYGCYSREDFNKKSISGRKYDNERRRILYCLKSEYIDESNYNGNSKYIRLVYDMYNCTQNFLAKSFFIKSFKKNDVVLFFIIQQILNNKDSSLSIQEIMEEISLELPENIEEFNESTVRRKLVQLRNEGLLDISEENNKKLYKIGEDLFVNFSNEEVIDLLNAVRFYNNVSQISLPGHYLEKTVKDYLKYERKIEAQDYDIFMFKHNHLQKIIDDEVTTIILICINEERKVKFSYKNVKASQEVIPLKIIFEQRYGRQYLFSINEELNTPILFRIDRITDIYKGEKTGKTYRYSDYEEYLNNSWCATLLNKEQGLIKVEVEFTIDEKRENYIIKRLEKEKRWGTIEKMDNGKYLYSIDVTDPLELVLWLRSFTGYIEIRSSNKHNLQERLTDECKEALKNYGVIQ